MSETQKTKTNQINYAIQYNGSSTYMVVNNNGDCLFATDTLRKATNFLKRAVAQGS